MMLSFVVPDNHNQICYFIEPMVEEDIEYVQKIERASFNTCWSADMYRKELHNMCENRYIVARKSVFALSNNEPQQHVETQKGFVRTMWDCFLGITSLIPQEDPIIGYGGLWVGVDEAHITAIAVSPEYRQQGIGELLLNGLIDLAWELNISRLLLEVRISNVVAQRLYLKYGFVPAYQRRHYYTDNGEHALVMWTEPIHTPEFQQRLTQLRNQLFHRLYISGG